MKKIDVRHVLSNLPEPILVVGNKKPDGDSVGSIVAVLAFLRNQGIEAYARFVGDIPTNLVWMVNLDQDTNSSILEDYSSLVVVDDTVNSDRLGIPIKDVPILNIDHHMSNFENSYESNVMVVHEKVPATACILIDHGIAHPALWISIFQDTVGLTVDSITASRYIVKLASLLADTDTPLTDELQEEMLLKQNKVLPINSIEPITKATLYTFIGTRDNKQTQMCLGVTDSPDPSVSNSYLSLLRKYSDVTCVMSSATGLGSFRSHTYENNVLAYAKLLGGGGHVRAAGFSVPTENFSDGVDRVIDIITKDFENLRTKVYY